MFQEIYPRSYMDSNNDGIGDLNGIASKMEYLKWLGVDAIWIAPCFPSPQVDFGYDVSDYENIDPDVWHDGRLRPPWRRRARRTASASCLTSW